jgi:hypothetical protein
MEMQVRAGGHGLDESMLAAPSDRQLHPFSDKIGFH